MTLSVLGVFLYISLSKIVHHSIDSSLMSRAKALATLVHSDNNKPEFNFSDEVMWEYNSPKSKHFFQIRRRDGTTLEKSASLGNQELPFGEKERRDQFQDHPVKLRTDQSHQFFCAGGKQSAPTPEKLP